MWNLFLRLGNYQRLKQLPELNIEDVELFGKPLSISGLPCSSRPDKKYPQGWRLELKKKKKKVEKNPKYFSHCCDFISFILNVNSTFRGSVCATYCTGF